MNSPIEKLKRKKTRSLSSVIFNTMTITFVPGILILGLVSLLLFIQGLSGITTRVLDNEVRIAADRVGYAIRVYKNIAEDLGTIPLLGSDATPLEEKRNCLTAKAMHYNLEKADLLSFSGKSILYGTEYNFEKNIKEAAAGKITMTSPFSDEDGNQHICFFAPLWAGGMFGNPIISVVYISVNYSEFDEIISGVKFGENAYAYAVPEDQLDPIIRNHEEGAVNYFNHGQQWCVAASHIPETEDWHLVIHSPYNDFLRHFQLLAVIIILITIVSFAFTRAHAKLLANRIGNPSKYIALRLKKAADGDFTTHVKVDNDLEEVKMIAEATQRLVVRMNMALNGNELYMNKLFLSDLVDQGALQKMVDTYSTTLKANMIMRDVNGVVLAGTENPDPEVLLHSKKVMMNGRSYGMLELTALPGCSLTEDELENRLNEIILNMQLFGLGALEKNLTYKIWKENEQVNIRQLMLKNAEIVEQTQKWIKEIDNLTQEKSPKQIKTELLILSAQARELLTDFQDSSLYTQFSTIGDGTKDEEYSLESISDTFKRSVHMAYMDGETDCQVQVICHENTTVFGDRHTVESILTQIVGALTNEKIDEIKVEFSHQLKTYSDDVIIKVSTSDVGFISGEVNKFKLWQKDTLNLDVKNLSFFEQQIVSALRVLERSGGTHSITVVDGRIELSFVVPQLKVADKGGNR